MVGHSRFPLGDSVTALLNIDIHISQFVSDDGLIYAKVFVDGATLLIAFW
jgi:hypothetical protein